MISQDSYKLKYGVDDHPPLHITIMCGLQVILSTVGGPVIAVYIIHSLICTKNDEHNLLFAELLSTSIFASGLATFMQVTWGVRLPALQGSSFTFLAPIAAMMNTQQYRCPAVCDTIGNNATITGEGGLNATEIFCEEEPWRSRLLEINGCLILASLVEVTIGLTGAMGSIQRYVGPITICPTIALVGLTLYPATVDAAQQHWGVAGFTGGLYIFFIAFLGKYNVPLPSWSPKKGCNLSRYPIFKVYSNLIAVTCGCLLCLILTLTNSLPDDPTNPEYAARIDSKLDVLGKSKWFFWPFPGYWGAPTFSIGLSVGFIAVVLSSITESVGDYYAMAAVCGLPTPPKHAVNRGILMEGISSVVSGLLGACHATSTYSAVVGLVTVTGVGSRSTYQVASLVLIVCGVFGKFGAALSIIPAPVLGGMGIAGLGIILSLGLSFLRHCDTTSVRNLAILGISLMLGMILPRYVSENPTRINTGISDLDQVLTLFLGTGMFIGSFVAFVLDNIAPGSKRERGLLRYQEDLKKSAANESTESSSTPCSTYDLPIVSEWMKRQRVLTYIPFLPSYTERRWCHCKRRNGPTITTTTVNSELVDEISKVDSV